MKILKLAIKNLLANPLNLFLSVILFALGIGLISFLILLNTQMKEKFEGNLAGIDMVIGAKGSPLQMILSSMYHVDNPTGNISIKEARPFLRPDHPLIDLSVPLSLGDSYKGFRIVGTDHSFMDLYQANIEEGKLWEETMDVSLGKEVADATGLKIGDSFSSSHGFGEDDFVHDEVKFKVVGILEESGTVADQLLFTPSSSIWESHHDHGDHDHSHDIDYHVHSNTRKDLLSHEEKEITNVLVKFKNNKNFRAPNLPRNINENTDLQAASPAYVINRLYNMMGSGTSALRTLAILISIVSAISIFVFLYKSLKERKYELSLMRVMGGNRNQVFMLILLEGLVISLIGFIVGIAVSHISMEVFSGYLQDDFRYKLTGWRWIPAEWGLLLLSLIIGALAAFLPAYTASSTDINKTLSHK